MSSSIPRPEYPRPTFQRRAWINLNGSWRFGFDRPNFDHSIVVPYAYQADLSRIGSHALHDTVWYERQFTRPDAERLVLHFGAVDYRATVWINDVEIAQHEGGHTPFDVDISSAARPGDNALVVRADDPATDRTLPRGKQFWEESPKGIFYTPTTGIWQTVWLEPLPDRHLTGLHISPALHDGALDVDVAVSEPGLEVLLDVGLSGRRVAELATQAGKARVRLSQVVAWTPESPMLYDVIIRLVDDTGSEIDHVRSYAGVRSIGAAEGRFRLNGEPYVQRLVLDQGYFPGGWYTAVSDDAFRRDIELAKKLGFNGARKHQKIEDPRWLYWADRLGFLVWAEMPSYHQHSEQAEQRLVDELAAMVCRDWNHPSIVAWVPFNESFGLDALPPAERARVILQMYQLLHRLDGTRLVSSNDGWEHALTDLCAVHDYGSAAELSRRYRDLAAALEPSARPRPAFLPGFGHQHQPVVVSEFGGIALGSDGGGYRRARTPADLLRQYGALVSALMRKGPVDGFCYTQLTDVEQERNGLLTFERTPKVDPRQLRLLTETARPH